MAPGWVVRPSNTRGGAGTGPGVNGPPSAAALLDDLELTAQRNLALARLNSSPLPPIQTTATNQHQMGAGGPAGPGPNPAEQSLYSHLYGKEMGLMRKLTTGIDDYPTNHAAVARNYQQLLQQQQQQQQQQHPDPSTAHQQQMQQNFAAGHPHAAAAAKFNQFNYPNPGGLLKPCYDYQTSQQQHHQHPMQGPGSTGAGAPNQQMKKEIFNLSGTNGVDLYSPPASATASVSSATTPSSNGSSFMNLHQPSAAAAAAAAAAAMYANHFNTNGPNGAKLDANGDGLVDFNAMRNNATTNNSNNNGSNKVGGNNLIKSAESVLMARSSIMNNLNNNLNKIEPNTDTTTLNDSNNNTHNHPQQHHHGHGGGGGGFNGGNEDEIDKLSSPMTGTSTLTNTDLNDPSEQDEADDGYTIL
ncbi:transcription factor mef2A-like [Culex pipiens pallens]|uniref:transcription factor mef2A-like n=1 Tax=Culex pipiens pallens TaxID=42434 RepID=UPI0022AA3662|nr:transcription factor mef2A-like [Culex pipiens pallens]